MSQTGSMARRVLQAVATLGAVALVSLLGVLFLGAPPARAGTLASQISGTTTVPSPATAPTSVAPATSVKPPSSTVPATTVRSTPSPTAVPTTRVATTPATGPGAVVPPPTYATYTTSHPTTTVAPTTTTIAPLGNSLPVSPATLPLRTSGGNAHVNPVFAFLSGIGFLAALLIVAARMFITRPGGPDRRPLAGDDQIGSDAQLPVNRSL